ncbi:MAG: hypothetical protein E7266_02140 [Lachnospiraceae bacterium]|nr:hypothetical protein [Lachnospiraceae bacterium]
MNKSKLKKIGIISGITAASIALICGVILLVITITGKKDIVVPDNFLITIQYDELSLKDDFVVYDCNKNQFNQVDYLTVKNATLHIENKLEDITSVTVWVEETEQKKILSSTTIAGVGEENLTFSEMTSGAGVGDYAIFFAIEKDGIVEYFVATESSFEYASNQAAATENNIEITMMADISMDAEDSESIVINDGFIWNTNGYVFSSTDTLLFKSDSEDIMHINNHSKKALQTAGIICDTPNWTYEMTYIFDNFVEERFYYINAAKINNRDVDTSKIYVDNNEKLDRILTDGKLSIPENTKTVILGEDVYFQMVEGLIIDEPDINVLWEGAYAFKQEDADAYFNILTYNGVQSNKYMGGTGTSRFESGTIKGLELSKDGNTLNVVVGYADNFDISKAKIDSVVTENGTGEMISEDGNYYYVITDLQGNTYGYKINTELKNYSLPVIYLYTDSGKGITSNEEYVGGKVTVDYNGYVGSGGFDEIIDAVMTIRGRGNSSWKLDKKSYKIKFESKTSFFGLTKSKEWVLLANHADQSLMRNKLAMTVGHVLDNMLFTPNSFMVDVFVNGKYAGVYSLSEQIEIKEGRIEGEKDSTETDTDYLLEWNGTKETTSFGNNIISSPLCSYVAVLEPEEEILTLEQKLYIKDYLKRVDEAIMNDDNYEELIDVDSFIDWFILYELSYNTDGMMRRSDFFLKKKGGKLYAASPWDFDLAFANFSWDGDYYEQWICLGNPKTDSYKDGKQYVKDNWFRYLIKDDDFKKKLKKRWNEVKSDIYNESMDTLDKAELEVYASAMENFRTWDVLGVRQLAQSKKVAKLKTYEEQLDYLRKYVKDRYTWMNKEINSY